MAKYLVLTLALAVTVPLSANAADWLPEDGQASLAQQVAARLANTHLKTEDNQEELLSMARQAVAAIMQTIDSWGVSDLAERAPILAELGLPSSDNTFLQAIARYGACNFHLDALYGNLALDESAPSMRVTAAIASAAIPLATANLRHHFLAEGGTDEELRAFLTSEEMGVAANRITNSREMISYSWKECAPTLAALTESVTSAQQAPEGDS